MPILKWFSLIEALVISQILGKFCEKMIFEIWIYVLPTKWILCCILYYCKFEKSAAHLHWKCIEFQDLRWLPKKFDEFAIFQQIFLQKCAIEVELDFN